ncbi:V-type ATP synthase subunit C [Acidilobus saccharovorans 345-15]|uniref:V-type ATP synthase subunit C n=1 Tax=Acidilobus saccharovorans (strain DSM 16705 / JCM 18335 / VKM B-2471 / 345-15) TaxID=666510 RepID=D9PZ48_ACIS3|nr:V-type ATPase subunit [Acidilobus saccharovorans]ADL19835.1 V-type ATP synthase subunit C [Acidilobus saccharovorans 345-15]
MAGPADYAKVVPLLRYLKSRMLGPKVRELAPPLAEAVAVLRDSMYAPVAEAKDLEGVERALASLYFSTVEEVYRLSPDEAKGLAAAFAKAKEVEDLMIVARAIAEGQRPPRWLPSAEWRLGSMAYVLQEVEASPTMTRLQEVVRDRDLAKTLAMASEAYAELRQPEVFTFFSLTGSFIMFRSAVAGFTSKDVGDVESVVCPLIEERAALGVLEAWAIRVNPKTFARAIEGPKVCGVSWDLMAAAYERGFEGELSGLILDVAPLLRRSRLEGKTRRELMVSVRRSARLAAQRAAEAVYEGYPFTPALVAAALTLLMLEVDNIRSALSGIMLNLTQEELEQALA